MPPCRTRSVPRTSSRFADNLDRLEWRCLSASEFLREAGRDSLQCCNLSDIFEYLSPEAYLALLEQLADAGSRGCRLVYWNLFVPRRRPQALAGRLRPLERLAARLHASDRAFFYNDLVIEEVI